MRLAVLSDTRLPTNISFPGHGLGKLALALATGLQALGHEVTLFAGQGSAWEGQLVTFNDELEYATAPLEYDVVLDITHQHKLQEQKPNLKIVNISVDREHPPGKNAVFPSEAHRVWHRYTPACACIIPHGVEFPDLPDVPQGEYFAYLSMFHAPKQPNMAADAARLAGVELVMCGVTPPAPPPHVHYIGALSGDDRLRFLAGAKALLYPASTESAGLVPLEAASVGTPSIVSSYGGAPEQILEGVTGYAVHDTEQMVEAIAKVGTLERAKIRQWVYDNRRVETMVQQYEKLCYEVASGVTW
jgi:glycosyltransferase involved in cell wall biosynthesis